jgi:hypothetical protein
MEKDRRRKRRIRMYRRRGEGEVGRVDGSENEEREGH